MHTVCTQDLRFTGLTEGLGYKRCRLRGFHPLLCKCRRIFWVNCLMWSSRSVGSHTPGALEWGAFLVNCTCSCVCVFVEGSMVIRAGNFLMKNLDSTVVGRKAENYYYQRWGGGHFSVDEEGHMPVHPRETSAVSVFTISCVRRRKDFELPLTIRIQISCGRGWSR